MQDGDRKFVLAAAGRIHAHHQNVRWGVLHKARVLSKHGEVFGPEGIVGALEGGIIVFACVGLLVIGIEEAKLGSIFRAFPWRSGFCSVRTDVLACCFAILAWIAQQQARHKRFTICIDLACLCHYVGIGLARGRSEQQRGVLLLRHGQDAGLKGKSQANMSPIAAVTLNILALIQAASSPTIRLASNPRSV
jgi:hypothetical protein